MGIELETMLANMWSPHKVKLAVSGCPRNCAESGIKDVGIIAVDSGWEIHVGGNGGIRTEVARFLCKVRTPEEVKEYTGAFLQLYREEAYYLDRTVHYIERVGLTTSGARWSRTPTTAARSTSGCCSRSRACPIPGPSAWPARRRASTRRSPWARPRRRRAPSP